MHRGLPTRSLMLAACGLSLMATAFAQAPASPPQTPASPPQAPANAAPQVFADMNRLMRGVLYPPANVVFSAQVDNPADKKWPDLHDPSMSTDPLISTFGGWVAVENAALALAESATLLTLPRSCSNGVPAPTKDPEWVAFVQMVRDGSMQAYKAAQAKDQDKMIEASNALNASCAGCHRKWRDRRAAGGRCK